MSKKGEQTLEEEAVIFEKRGKRIFVESLDGESYGGDAYVEIVEQMRTGSWGGEQSDGVRGYMKQVAKRIYDWSNKTVRINSAEAFLQDLQKEGIIKMRVRKGGAK